MTAPMVSMPLDCVRMLLEGTLRPCEHCGDHAGTHINTHGWWRDICEECLSDCADDERESSLRVHHIDAARAFNAAMDAASFVVAQDPRMPAWVYRKAFKDERMAEAHEKLLRGHFGVQSVNIAKETDGAE